MVSSIKMAGSVFCFNKKPASASILLGPVPEGIVTLQIEVWPFKASHQKELEIFKSSTLRVCLSYYNHIFVSAKGQHWISEAQLAVGTWNLIEIVFSEGLEIKVNSSSEARHQTGVLNVHPSELARKIVIGSTDFRGIIAMPKLLQGRFFKFSEHFSQYRDKHGIQPIRSLEELGFWKPDFDPHNKARTRFVTKVRHGREVLACHDMCHNYKEDVKTHKKPFCYRYLHFDRTQYFVYFSHSRVTIPPPGWTEVCHQNSAKSLGTFITEWEEGEKENEKLLQMPEFYIEKLVDLMLYYGFDGYLLNFESGVKDPGRPFE